MGEEVHSRKLTNEELKYVDGGSHSAFSSSVSVHSRVHEKVKVSLDRNDSIVASTNTRNSRIETFDKGGNKVIEITSS